MKKYLPLLSGIITFIVVFILIYWISNNINLDATNTKTSTNKSVILWGFIILIIVFVLLIFNFLSKKETDSLNYEYKMVNQTNNFENQFLNEILAVINSHKLLKETYELDNFLNSEKLLEINKTLLIIEDRLYLNNEEKLNKYFAKYRKTFNEGFRDRYGSKFDQNLNELEELRYKILSLLKQSKAASNNV